MDYINKIVINWILYNNKVTYNYEVRESIVEYVLKNSNKALDIVSFLYCLGKDSTNIIKASKKGKLNEYMFDLKEEMFNHFSSDKDLELMRYLFLTENANKYKDNVAIDNSYLENLLIKFVNKMNLFKKDTLEYEMFLNLIKDRCEDVMDALFIMEFLNINIIASIRSAFRRDSVVADLDKLMTIVRNAKIELNSEYHAMKNVFILSLEEELSNTHADIENEFYDFEEHAYIEEWLNFGIGKNENILLNWWKSISDFKENTNEFNKVKNYILSNMDDFLEALMAMYTLGINISRSINISLMGENNDFEDLINHYKLAGINLKMQFKDSYKKENFIEILSSNLKRKREVK